MLTLYYSPGACSLAAHIALEEAGLAFQSKPISLRKGQQRTPEFLAVNPFGKVPALVVDGTTLTENPAILSYIADISPAAGLLPAESPLARGQALSLLAWLSSAVHVSFGGLFGAAYLIEDEAERERYVAKTRATIEKHFSVIDGKLAGRDWLLGRYSVADGYAHVFARWAKGFFGFDMARWPNYAAHMERVAARPAVQRALARESEGQAQLDAAA